MVGSSLELIPLNMHQAQQYPRTGREPATTSTKDSQDPIGGGGKRVLMTGQGFEKNRLISEVVTVERLITSRLGFDAD